LRNACKYCELANRFGESKNLQSCIVGFAYLSTQLNRNPTTNASWYDTITPLMKKDRKHCKIRYKVKNDSRGWNEEGALQRVGIGTGYRTYNGVLL
jgi:hypothetical protein